MVFPIPHFISFKVQGRDTRKKREATFINSFYITVYVVKPDSNDVFCSFWNTLQKPLEDETFTIYKAAYNSIVTVSENSCEIALGGEKPLYIPKGRRSISIEVFIATFFCESSNT